MQTKLSKNSVIDWRDRFNEAYNTQRVSDDPNTDMSTDIPLWRNRTRWLSYNSPLAKAPIQNVSTLTVGQGFCLNPRPDVENPEKVIRNLFRLYDSWQNVVSIDGQTDGPSVLRQICTAMFRDGDILVSIVQDNDQFRLNLIDATKIQTPPKEYLGKDLCYMGVVVKSKVIKGYWVKSDSIKTPWKFYPCKSSTGSILNILLKNPLTSDITGTYRGIPVLAPCLSTIDDLRRLLQNELRASDSKTSVVGVMETERPASTGEDLSDEIFEGMGYRKLDGIEMFSVPRGDKLTWTVGSDISNPEITNVYKLYLKQISSVFNIAYPALYADFDDNTYSTNQSILFESWKNTKIIQKYLINNLWKPLYDLNVQLWVAQGKIDGVTEYDPTLSDCSFHGLPNSFIKQKDQTDSTIKKIEAGLMSPQMAILEDGNNPWQVLDDNNEWAWMSKKVKDPTTTEIDLQKNDQIISIFQKVYMNEMSKLSAAWCLKTFYNYSDDQLTELNEIVPKVNIEALTNTSKRAGL